MRISFRHTLPRARDWQNRQEFGELCEWWCAGGAGICALVGIGGVGKTAISDRFLQVLPGVFPPHPGVSKREAFPDPSRLLVFSFSEGNPDEFFRELVMLLRDPQGPGPELSASYQQALELLKGQAETGKPGFLIVLDGLENEQDDGRRGGKFGGIVDGRLRDLVLRIADGWVPNVSLLVTSRFRLFDPLAQRSLHYLQIPVERLDQTAALALLRARGLKGSDHELDTIARENHYHALSIDLIAGYIGTFCNGDPGRLPATHHVPEEQADEDPGVAALRDQERRFSEIAQWYRTVLSERDPAALALVERVCLFRLGIDAATLTTIFTGEGKGEISGEELANLTESEIERKLRQLTEWRLVEAATWHDASSEPKTSTRNIRYQVHPAVRDGFLAHLDQGTARLGHLAAMKQLEGVLSGRPRSDAHPSFAVDLIEEIIHHAVQAGKPKAAMDLYHHRMGGFGRLGYRAGGGDLERGRRICESLIGPLVFPEMKAVDGISHSDITRTLGEWATYSLELGRLDECVRIRKLQLAEPARQGPAHGSAPPRRYAEGYGYLGQALILAGKLEEAMENLTKGFQIAHQLGDASAGKVVCGFSGEASSLLGRMEDAAASFDNSAYLQNVAEYEYPLSRPGEFDNQPLYSLGGVLLNAHQLRRGLFDDAENNARFNLRRMKRMNPDSAIIPRINLVMAAIAAQKGSFAEAYDFCRETFEWAVARDSYAMLCGTALTRAQIALRRSALTDPADRDTAECLAAARASLQDGIHIARQCGFGIYHIDLMLERARVRLLSGDPASALEDIRVAVDEGVRPPSESGQPRLVAASDPECGYAWGIAEGRHRRGEALLLEAAQKLGNRQFDTAQRDRIPAEVWRQIESARTELEEARLLRQRIQDPKLAHTEQLLEELERGLLTTYPLAVQWKQSATVAGSHNETVDGASHPYDVFFSHNSRDKPSVRRLAEALKARGLSVWLDEAELIPGRPWQEAIEQLIQVVRSAAVFVGPDGLGPWENLEMRACLSEFVRRGLPVIPVVLPGAPRETLLPLFLSQFTSVSLRDGITEEGIGRLERGISLNTRRVPGV